MISSKSVNHRLIYSLLAVLIFLVSAGEAYAQIEGAPVCPWMASGDQEAFEGTLTATIVTCMRDFLSIAIDEYFAQMSEFIQGFLGVAVILAVTIHGAKLLTNSLRNPWRETATFFFKLGVVYIFVLQFDEFYHFPFLIMDHLIWIIVSNVPDQIEGYNFGMSAFQFLGAESCTGYDTAAADGNDRLLIWKQYDCMLAAVIGFGGVGLAVGFIGIAIWFFATGGVAFGLLFMVINIVWFMISSALKALLIYAIAIVNIAILIMISPLIFPTILFHTTFSMFTTWMKELLDSIIQPVFIFTFVGFMLVFVTHGVADFHREISEVGRPHPNDCPDIFGIDFEQVTTVGGALTGPDDQASESQTGSSDQKLFQTVGCYDEGDLVSRLIDIFISLVTLLAMTYLLYGFYDHLQRLSSRFVRLLGINYFSIMDNLIGGSGNLAMSSELARQAMRNKSK